MFHIVRQEMLWGGRKLVLETGRLARQADGAVLASYGGTSVLCTVVAHKEASPDLDFLPLTVHYQEKSFAAGNIPGGFFKREGRPSERETLISRLIDRSLRPLFPDGYHHETQVLCTVLSYDPDHEADALSIIGASAALTLSGIPFLGPVGSAKVGLVQGQCVLNPNKEQRQQSQLDMVVSGTHEGVLMVESEAHELSEAHILEAVMWAHEQSKPVIDGIVALAERAARDPWDLQEEAPEKGPLYACIKQRYESPVRQAYQIADKHTRRHRMNELKAQAQAELLHEPFFTEKQLSIAFECLGSYVMRSNILDQGVRIDGRDLKTIRPIATEIGLLDRVHGSALFTRGSTQALVVTTLGTGEDEQIVDGLEGEYRERFMLHYNFPPYSVGELGRMGSPGRREIGHGKLAWRAMHPMMPSKEKFPYTLRVVSEITESNGSSSMASVCGATLALMDAGVPLERPVAGIAMGLVKEGDRIAILSDILGDEDHLGDMDFKVAGTEQGVTALQMDLKITSINRHIMETALEQARQGRLHILAEMAKTISVTRPVLNENAPKIQTIRIHRDKIREVIGSGGKVIRELCETTGAKIDIEDDGTIHVSGVNQSSVEAAIQRIEMITFEPKPGMVLEGPVVRIEPFGAFVSIPGGKDGLVHISEIAPGRINKVTDVLQEGQVVTVKILEIDPRGKIRLSIKALLDLTGASASQGGETSITLEDEERTSRSPAKKRPPKRHKPS